MASIEKRSENVYRIVVCVGYDVRGKKIRKSKTITFNNPMSEKQKQKELQKNAVLFENSVKNGNYLDGEKITFQEFALKWLEKQSKKYAPGTLIPCKTRLYNRILPEFGHMKLTKIQTKHLEDFYAKLKEEGSRLEDFYVPTKEFTTILLKYKTSKLIKLAGITNKTCIRLKNGNKTNLKTAKQICNALSLSVSKMFKRANNSPLSDKTIKNHHSDISSIFTLAEKWRLIKFNPAKYVDFGKPVKKKANYYNNEQVKSLLIALDNEPYENMTYKVLISLALDTGVRSSELCGLKWDDVNFENGTISITKQRQYIHTFGIIERQPKTVNGIRTISISPSVLAKLKTYKQKQAQDKLQLGTAWQNGLYLFKHSNGQDLHPIRPYKWFIKFLEKHNLPKITLHQLRHTNASLLIANGIDPVTLAERLGHGDKNITLNTYSHMINEREKLVALQMENIYTHFREDISEVKECIF